MFFLFVGGSVFKMKTYFGEIIFFGSRFFNSRTLEIKFTKIKFHP